ncbi:MAG: PAS domain-containing protein [Rhodospirillales bacterium]|nr:PAS domain-containing protein [Rhodospirillales bacterium]
MRGDSTAPAASALPLADTVIDGFSVLNALPLPITVVDADANILRVNDAAERFFQSSGSQLAGKSLRHLLPDDSPLFSLIEQVRTSGSAVSDYGLALDSARFGRRTVNVQAAPMADAPGLVVVALQERSIAEMMDRQLAHRGAARSLSGMGALFAHEVKNPLSGIRGAAQLLEQGAAPADLPLTALIRDEADRICALVDRMTMFVGLTSIERKPVNIHEVLDRVHRIAGAGFGRHAQLETQYDPSLPPVLGDRDQLIQAFLNLVKNACEALPPEGGEVVLRTAYQHGPKLAISGGSTRVHLPLVVTVRDSGPGIPEDIKPYLFDPFVTSKPNGSGLGLALVAKVIGDHGGVVEFESSTGGTVFRVMLPIASVAEHKAGEPRS